MSSLIHRSVSRQGRQLLPCLCYYSSSDDASSSSSSSSDPSVVWKSPTVSKAFTDIRDSVPLGQEQLDLMIRIIRTFQQEQHPHPQHDNNNATNGGHYPSMTWLDLGCGDGPLSRRLLQEFPNSRGIMVDFSEPMLEAARTKLATAGSGGGDDRITIVLGDLSSSNWMTSLQQQTKTATTTTTTTTTTETEHTTCNKELVVNVIVSSFAIHHLTNLRKQELYQEIYSLLSPGGVFLNLEHVASPDTTVEGIFDGAFVDSMYKFFQGTKSYEECQRAVQYDLTVDDDANILVPVETQCDWLREIGFQHVDCYFKFLIVALFGGVKK